MNILLTCFFIFYLINRNFSKFSNYTTIYTRKQSILLSKYWLPRKCFLSTKLHSNNIKINSEFTTSQFPHHKENSPKFNTKLWRIRCRRWNGNRAHFWHLKSSRKNTRFPWSCATTQKKENSGSTTKTQSKGKHI